MVGGARVQVLVGVEGAGRGLQQLLRRDLHLGQLAADGVQPRELHPAPGRHQRLLVGLAVVDPGLPPGIERGLAVALVVAEGPRDHGKCPQAGLVVVEGADGALDPKHAALHLWAGDEGRHGVDHLAVLAGVEGGTGEPPGGDLTEHEVVLLPGGLPRALKEGAAACLIALAACHAGLVECLTDEGLGIGRWHGSSSGRARPVPLSARPCRSSRARDRSGGTR